MAENLRRDRKKQHIEEYLKSVYKNETLFEDIYIEHNSLPELDFDQVDTSIDFLDKYIKYPIMIDAITGGTGFSQEINRSLSKIVKEYGIPIAVGSQTIALKNKESHNSFKIVRETIGQEGIVISNLSANASVEDANIAMELLDADGIELHLNPAQELVMKEGDRSFKGLLKNIENIVKSVDKPVIVKEVGFGISKKTAKSLYDIGVRYINIAGKGGTNFIEIEAMRNNEIDFRDMYSWGIPTALSLIDTRSVSDDLSIIASGGIGNSIDVVKSICLGANIVGISGAILRILLEEGYGQANKYMRDLTHKLKILMMLTGSKDIEELKSVPYKLTGRLKDLCE